MNYKHIQPSNNIEKASHSIYNRFITSVFHHCCKGDAQTVKKQLYSKKTAVFSDIHSNYYAFKACFEDAIRSGVDLFVFLGDYVSDLADARKVMDLVYEIRAAYPTVCLRGNREGYMLDHANKKIQFDAGSRSGSLLYTSQQLRDADITFFKNLPIYDQIEINAIPFEIAHAAKTDDRFYFDGTDDATEAILSQMAAPYMLAGHSHQQFLVRRMGRTILNPGSIGIPRGYGHLSQYAILDFTDGSVKIDLRQISYDIKSMIHRQFESGLTEIAPHWAISVLYDTLTGKAYAMELLNRVSTAANGDEAVMHDEVLWHQTAANMGMKFSEEEILAQFAPLK